MLHGKTWRPGLVELKAAKREAKMLSALLDMDPFTGPEATKETFMKEVERASLVHIGSGA